MESVKNLNMDADEMLIVLSALEEQTDKGSGADTQATVWR